MVTSGAVLVRPLPHIPGCEISGTIEGLGKHVKGDLHEGDRIIVHSRVFDGTCDMCLTALICYVERVVIVVRLLMVDLLKILLSPQRNVLKVPNNINWDIAASLPVTTLTAFHALKEALLQFNEYLLAFGASGNTGMMAIQFGKRMGAKVIAVSKDEWVKDFGADYIINEYDKVVLAAISLMDCRNFAS